MLLFFVLLSFLQRPPDVMRILESTRQEWAGDMEEKSKGINYEIRLVVKKSSAKLQFVSITVDNLGCTYSITNATRPRKGERFQKGDTLLISALLKNPPGLPPQKEKPYPVIGYTYKKALYYFSIRQGIPVSHGKNP
jgi:hypothetical protein